LHLEGVLSKSRSAAILAAAYSQSQKTPNNGMAFLPPGLLRAGRPRAVWFGQHGAQRPSKSVFIHTLFTLFALSWLLVTACNLFSTS
jgi:hypothetical protein